MSARSFLRRFSMLSITFRLLCPSTIGRSPFCALTFEAFSCCLSAVAFSSGGNEDFVGMWCLLQKLPASSSRCSLSSLWKLLCWFSMSRRWRFSINVSYRLRIDTWAVCSLKRIGQDLVVAVRRQVSNDTTDVMGFMAIFATTLCKSVTYLWTENIF